MLGAARVGELKRRIVRDLTTTFAAQYARTVSLGELIAPQTLVACARRSTGAKYLVDPRLERKPLLIDRKRRKCRLIHTPSIQRPQY